MPSSMLGQVVCWTTADAKGMRELLVQGRELLAAAVVVRAMRLGSPAPNISCSQLPNRVPQHCKLAIAN